MALEDFTTYTEVDPNSHISKTANHIDHTAIRNEDAYVYKDMGGGHFTDFTHLVQVQASYTSQYGVGFIWVLTNDVGEMYGLYEAGKTVIGVYLYAESSTDFQIRIREYYGGSGYGDSYSGSYDTPYYLTIEKSSTTLTCKIYSDADRTNLLDTLSLALHFDASYSFQYIFGCNTWNSGISAAITADIDNLDLQEAVAVIGPFPTHFRI